MGKTIIKSASACVSYGIIIIPGRVISVAPVGYLGDPTRLLRVKEENKKSYVKQDRYCAVVVVVSFSLCFRQARAKAKHKSANDMYDNGDYPNQLGVAVSRRGGARCGRRRIIAAILAEEKGKKKKNNNTREL